MTTFPTQSPETISLTSPLSEFQLAYFQQRQKNRIFEAIVGFFADCYNRGEITKKQLALRLSKDPSQITRWLSGPSNLELDSISDILAGLNAEMDFAVRSFAHSLSVEAETTSSGAISVVTPCKNPPASTATTSDLQISLPQPRKWAALTPDDEP
jgi:transcriptional regulator with XRE-family HTH domain